jgi:hypothetical protein
MPICALTRLVETRVIRWTGGGNGALALADVVRHHRSERGAHFKAGGFACEGDYHLPVGFDPSVKYPWLALAPQLNRRAQVKRTGSI